MIMLYFQYEKVTNVVATQPACQRGSARIMGQDL